MQIKVLVLGSSGMAGHVASTYLKKNSRLDVHNLSHRLILNDETVIMDVSDFKSLGQHLDILNPDIIVNCIGILNQNAENNKDKAILLNGYLPHFLEKKYLDSPTRIIHVSTDCVFSGKTGGYVEDSFRDGDTFYERSKAMGELINSKDLTFRTSIVGPEFNSNGIGLFNWFMRQSGQIKGYTRAIWTGITTIELARAIEAAIFTDLSGLYHLVPNRTISKYGLLCLFKKVFKRDDIEINEYDDFILDKSLINTRHDFEFMVSDYERMIVEMRNWMKANREFYPHYNF